MSTHTYTHIIWVFFIFRLKNVHNWRSQTTWACQILSLTEDNCYRSEQCCYICSSSCPPWTEIIIPGGLLLTPTSESSSFYNPSLFFVWLTHVLLSLTGKFTRIWRFAFWSTTTQGPDGQLVLGNSCFDFSADTGGYRELSEDIQNSKQDRQSTYNVTLRRVRATIVAVETQ